MESVPPRLSGWVRHSTSVVDQGIHLLTQVVLTRPNCDDQRIFSVGSPSRIQVRRTSISNVAALDWMTASPMVIGEAP